MNFFVLHAHVLLQILKKRRDDKHPFYSQVSSYRWLSLNHASHHVDGLNQYEVRRSFQTKENQEQVITLLRNSGFTWE
ncbi:hypothetical protein YC2023_040337 [Brassica napus]